MFDLHPLVGNAIVDIGDPGFSFPPDITGSLNFCVAAPLTTHNLCQIDQIDIAKTKEQTRRKSRLVHFQR